ncbi:MAG: hypothetical protein JWO67_2500 [Streptosporangiaceae bacterium]|jgi:hypothetical protein|nr:hypothetical protein [Streptosporangiaceae bacterium]
MRVRFTEDSAIHVEGSYRVEDFKKGQEFDGELAGYLLRTGAPVEVVEDDDPDGPGVDLDGDGVPEGSAKQVLDWVGEDADKAKAALEAEQAKDKPRGGLVTSLTKLIG